MAMTDNTEAGQVREVVGVFSDAASLQDAIDELLTSGFDQAELSLLAGEDAVVEKLGHKYEKVEDIEDDASVPRAAYVSRESIGAAEGILMSSLLYIGTFAAASAVLASGGALATAIAGAVVGGGGATLIGSALGKLIEEHHAAYLQQQLEHGGLLVWVRTWNAGREKAAIEILSKHSGRDVHAHSLPA